MTVYKHYHWYRVTHVFVNAFEQLELIQNYSNAKQDVVKMIFPKA